MSSPTPTTRAWRARYGDATPSPATLSDTLQTLLEHRSVRAYTAQDVDEAMLVNAIAAAQSASSSSNLQVWSVVAVRDAQRKARLAELAGHQRHIVEAPLLLCWVLDLSRLRRLGAACDHATEGLDYLESFVVGAVDTSLAAQNAAVAFEAQGLGIVYIGGMRNQPRAVAELLALPADSMVLFGMCVGYPDPTRPADIKPRLPMPVVLHHERYDAGQEAAEVARYDAAMSAFQRAQGRRDTPWSVLALDRVRGPESLSGRHVLREALQALGFDLR